ncbi:MAG: hypothetical protein CML68_23260 [Rhodobacteraceae bacterium]|nr:hypothetical protein [Paracoccaceae bacterium]
MIGLFPMLLAAHAVQDTAMAYGRMYLSAQEVIQRRTLQMAFGQMGPEEVARMIFEKPAAFATSFERAAQATVAGKDPLTVALAAVNPIGQKTQANARRLRRG